MKLLQFSLAALLGFWCASAQADSLSLGAVTFPGGSNVSIISIGRQGPATFINPGVFRASLEDTLIHKTFGGLGAFSVESLYDEAALDFGGGFRWTERVTNNTDTAWTDFHMTLEQTPGVFFTDLPVFSPSLVNIAFDDVTGGMTITKNDLLGSVALGNGRKSLDIVFANPVAPGASFDVHAPIEGLSGTTSFVLVEQPSVVPVPAAGWSGLAGLAGLVVLKLRRR